MFATLSLFAVLGQQKSIHSKQVLAGRPFTHIESSWGICHIASVVPLNQTNQGYWINIPVEACSMRRAKAAFARHQCFQDFGIR